MAASPTRHPSQQLVCLGCLALLSLTLTTPAHADVFKCIDGSGHVTYTNDAGLARGCTRLKQDLPVSAIPAPTRATPPSPNFPSVSRKDQRERDDARLGILRDELATETSALESARAALAEQESIRLGNEANYQKKLDRLKPFQDKVELHQRNVEALEREIAKLR